MEQSKIGVVGAGNMATALVRGWLDSALLGAEQVRASDVSKEQLSKLSTEFRIQTHEANAELASWADVLFLAVKPQVVDAVLADVRGSASKQALIVSIAAGVTTERIEAGLGGDVRVIRAMPNTPALVLEGASAIAAGKAATEDDVLLAKKLFEAVGRVVVLAEPLLDAVTGLSGSGPAYVMLAIEALADGGVNMGLSRDVALLLAAQTVYGSAKWLLESGEHPATLKDRVTSPGGTTIAGVYALERSAFRKGLMNAVERATLRSIELGRTGKKP